MKRILFSLFILVQLVTTDIAGQSLPLSAEQPTIKSSKSLSIGPAIPVGIFAETHWLGASIYFSWSKHRFGKMQSTPTKDFGLLLKSSVSYFFGKEEGIYIYQFTNGNFVFADAGIGAIYNYSIRGNITLTAGPAIGIEKKYTRIWGGVNLASTYYFNEKIGITPGFQLLKDFGSDALFDASVKATFAF